MSIGKVNAYECESCAALRIMVDRAEGVTPMFLACHVCGGRSSSYMYGVPQDLVPSHEWFKPTDDELVAKYASMPRVLESMRRHVANGGLDIRPIGETS